MTDEHVTFVQHALPPVAAGSSTITVDQVVKISGTVVDRLRATRDVYVTGARYRLDPTVVNSVFPPNGGSGDFENVLPHVVLTEPTLPWQRDLGVEPVPRSTTHRPWMAVLLFDAADGAVDGKTVSLRDLTGTPDRFHPARAREPGETDVDPVEVIDVPVKLFDAIAPSAADLAWLVHVRHTDAAHVKPDDGGAAAPGDYAVVFGNRLPAPGSVSTAHLVSLEGFADYLPTGDGTRSAALPAAATHVRLVSLHRWQFTTANEKARFVDAVKGLAKSPCTLQLELTTAANDPAGAAVQNAYRLGYVPMDHELRTGDTTVSWYRGPLLPLGAEGLSPEPPFGSADALMVFDPATGMFDVGHAAAWELGRLLALRDKAFASALFRWKVRETRAAASALEQDVLADRIGAAAQVTPGTGDGVEAPAPGQPATAAVLSDVVTGALRSTHDAARWTA
ncbi:MAG TPA: hypothetical protein VIG64_04205 [Actinomycetota bacterium]